MYNFVGGNLNVKAQSNFSKSKIDFEVRFQILVKFLPPVQKLIFAQEPMVCILVCADNDPEKWTRTPSPL